MQKWRNWGDHPVIVTVGMLAAIASVVGMLKSCGSDAGRDSRPAEVVISNKDVEPTNYKLEASKKYSKLADEYVALRDDPKANERDVAIKRLEALQAERHWLMWVRLDEKEDFRTEEERTWAIYGKLVSEQEFSVDERAALLAIKKHDAAYFSRLDGKSRVDYLEESLARIGADIKTIETAHPTFWRRMFMTNGINESRHLPNQEHNNLLEPTSGR